MPLKSLHGLLNIDKPAGLSSRDIVDRVARLVRPAKAGHAGTLDPLATGVLVVCVGAATRLVPFVQEQRKEYRAVFRLGCTSNTDDVTGDVIAVENALAPTDSEVALQLNDFIGEISQVPPQFSAVHVAGKRAYQLARDGRQLELPPRPVTIYRIVVVSYDYPRLELDIECSSGTYVRSIGRDLGAKLGCGEVMSELTRTRIGPFELSAAIPLAALTADRLLADLLPAAIAVAHLPQHHCTSEELREINYGRPIPSGQTLEGKIHTHVALQGPSGELAGLATNLSNVDWLARLGYFRRVRPRTTTRFSNPQFEDFNGQFCALSPIDSGDRLIANELQFPGFP